MAKRIRVSSDNGANWFTLPGSTAELAREIDGIDDTIFGFDYQSNFPGLIGWNITSNAYVKGFAGYMAKLKKIGSTTAATGSAMSLVSGKTYQVDQAARQIWDRSATTVIKVGGTDQTAQVESIDYLFGRVTFKDSYTVSGAVTADHSYFPTTEIAKGRSYTLTQTANAIDTTDMPTAQANGGIRTFIYGLKTVELEIGGVFDATNAYADALQARDEVIVEINPDGNGESIARGFFRFTGDSQSGAVGDLEEETVTLALNVPDDSLMARPFGWQFSSSSTLNAGIRAALNAWQNATEIDVQYLPDGETGVAGNAIVSEITLAGELEGMNEFNVTFQGTGALSDVT